jgi:site-specific DNA recombinase
MKVEDRSRILHAIATARTWLDDLIAARVESMDAVALREGCSERSVRMTLSLACLSPEIVRAIAEGRLPRGIGIKRLAELPASWSEQHAALGF